ncbi:unnamed protein product [Caenorhabditis sp. 36 PRJEB53466]|nr:unnamed protein product [Caenorhabditis sp. 36 PRJEB53466]
MNQYLEKSVLFTILSVLYADRIDNGLIGNPFVQCGSEHLSINFKTRSAFEGHAYVKGHYSMKECRTDATLEPTVNLSIPYSACDVIRQRSSNPKGIMMTATIILSFHPMFITKTDKSYKVQCFYAESSKTVTQQLNVEIDKEQEKKIFVMVGDDEANSDNEHPVKNQSRKMNDQSVEKRIEYNVPLPECNYRVLNEARNEEVAFAKVGQVVYHEWSCASKDKNEVSPFCLTVHSCNVKDETGKEVQLFDENGCAVDKYLINNLEYSDDLSGGQVSQVFKFADQPSVFFQCKIRLGIKNEDGSCQRSSDNCPAALRGKRSAGQEDEDDFDVVSQTLTILDIDEPTKASKRKSELQFSKMIVSPDNLETNIACHNLDHNGIDFLVDALSSAPFNGIFNLTIDGASNFSINLLPELQNLRFLKIANSPDESQWILKHNQFRDVQVLRYTNCSLKVFPRALTIAFPALRELDLSENRLENIGSDSIHLQQLERLLINNNIIMNIGVHVFRYMPSLRFLELNGNVMKQLVTSDFTSAVFLRELSLRSNHIQYIEADTINPMLIVESGAFIGTPRLHSLNLRDNPNLSFISPFAFENNTAIYRLDMQNTGLKRIPLSILTHVSQLYIKDIALDCSCAARDMRDFGAVTIADWNDATCRTKRGIIQKLSHLKRERVHVSTEYYGFDIVLENDAGYYNCFTKYDGPLQTIELKVEKPDIQLNVSHVSTTSIHVSWSHNLKIQAVDRVALQITASNKNRFKRQVQLSLYNMFRSYNLVNLSADEVFEICLECISITPLLVIIIILLICSCTCIYKRRYEVSVIKKKAKMQQSVSGQSMLSQSSSEAMTYENVQLNVLSFSERLLA